MKNKTIGILAGMGPRSTSPFLELLLDECQLQYGAKYDIDYPHIMIYSLPTPFYIDREVDEDALMLSIKEGIKRLEKCDVDIIGIPCNSAHKYFEEIVNEIDVPTLNIIDETVESIKSGSRVSIFATEMTRTSGLYQEGLSKCGCDYVFDESWQENINQIILRIKNQEDITETKRMWNNLIQKVAIENVDAIIIACTDLNVVTTDDSEIVFIDSAKALAKGIIEKYLE